HGFDVTVEEADVGEPFLVPPGDRPLGVPAGIAGVRRLLGDVVIADFPLPAGVYARSPLVDPEVHGVGEEDLVGWPADLRVAKTVERKLGRYEVVQLHVTLRGALRVVDGI